LVKGLKSDSIWTKMIAIYPFVGGDATKHSYNLKNPAAFQITWNGTVTQNANGMTGNGSTGYGDTGISPSSQLTLNDFHMSLYSRTASTSVNGDMGCFASTSQYLAIYSKYTDNSMYGEAWATPSGELAAAVTNSQGLFVVTRRGSTDAEIYRNSTSIATKTTTQVGTRPATNIAIGRILGASEFSSRNIAGATVGSGLTGTDVANLASRIQTYQTTLSRQV
jgi:hypothetical protein